MPSKKQKTNGRPHRRHRCGSTAAAHPGATSRGAGAPRRTFTAGCCRWCRATPRPATPSRNATLARTLEPSRFTGTAHIPVVVHVVSTTAEQDISDEQVASQIEVLNRDFRATNPDTSTVPPVFAGLVADAQIEFFLATTDPDGEPTRDHPDLDERAVVREQRRRQVGGDPAEPTPGPPIGTSTCGCAR